MGAVLVSYVKAGWAAVAGAKKFHYFEEGRSLCGRWMYWGAIYQSDQGESDPARDCKGCSKKVDW